MKTALKFKLNRIHAPIGQGYKAKMCARTARDARDALAGSPDLQGVNASVVYNHLEDSVGTVPQRRPHPTFFKFPIALLKRICYTIHPSQPSGPFVYRLGHGLFMPVRGVRLS